MRLTHQTWLHPITTYLHRWGTCSAALHFLRRYTKMTGLAQKSNNFFWRGIHKLPNKWKKCIATDVILRTKYFLSFSCNKHVFSIKKLVSYLHTWYSRRSLTSHVNLNCTPSWADAVASLRIGLPYHKLFFLRKDNKQFIELERNLHEQKSLGH